MLKDIVHSCDIQDRGGAPDLIKRSCQSYLSVTKLFADAGYARTKLAMHVAHIETLAIEIVKRSDQAKGFVILSKRWIVERIFA